MSRQPSSIPGDFISETAVRDVLGRRRQPATAPPDDQARPVPTTPPRRLRRWSVAELLAGAFARPADCIGH